jgi:hypothetical protein
MIRNIVIDAVDAERLADFWAEAAGYERGTASGNYITLKSREQRFPQILIQKVPELKAEVKNRVHLDLPARRPDVLKQEVARLEGLGATQVQVVEEDGEVFTVLTDPEGNEFCVVVA